MLDPARKICALGPGGAGDPKTRRDFFVEKEPLLFVLFPIGSLGAEVAPGGPPGLAHVARRVRLAGAWWSQGGLVGALVRASWLQ